jgi:hypothetical protein
VRKIIDPPALVKSADVRNELLPKIRATYRRTTEDRRQLGKWLKECKEACIRAGDDWLAWLERETGIPHATASRWMNDENNNRQEESGNSHVGSVLPAKSLYEDDTAFENPEGIDESEPLPESVDDGEPIVSVRLFAAERSRDSGGYREAANRQPEQSEDEPAIVIGRDGKQYATEPAKVKQEGRPTREIAEAEVDGQEKAKAVVAAAADAPEWFADLLGMMDADGEDAAYAELKARQTGDDKPAEVLLDMGHQELPPQAVAAFQDLPFIRKLLAALDKCVKDCTELTRMPGGRFMHADSIAGRIREARQYLHIGRPAYVCPYCRGADKNCTCCKGGGWVTAGTFQQSPREMQKLQPVGGRSDD